LYLLFGDFICCEELTGGVCTIDLEAFILAGELLDKAEIVKRGGDVKKFRVKAELLLTAQLSREEIDAHGVIKEQIGGMLMQNLCGLSREQRIGNDERPRDARNIEYYCVLQYQLYGLWRAFAMTAK
jgi:hypothetical protein